MPPLTWYSITSFSGRLSGNGSFLPSKTAFVQINPFNATDKFINNTIIMFIFCFIIFPNDTIESFIMFQYLTHSSDDLPAAGQAPSHRMNTNVPNIIKNPADLNLPGLKKGLTNNFLLYQNQLLYTNEIFRR